MQYMLLTINNEAKFRVLYHRHLDIIMTCCLFAVCRMSRAPLQFNEIITSYKSQPQCLCDVFDKIYMDLIKNQEISIHFTIVNTLLALEI